MIKRTFKIYIETSVWSHYYHDDVPERRDATREFLDHINLSSYILYISPVVLREIGKSKPDKKEQLQRLIMKVKPTVLPPDERIAQLADQYMEYNAIPVSKRDDALHVAHASVYEMDALISWNQKHLANLRRRSIVNAVNMQNGFMKPLEMLTVWEVMDYEE